MRGATPPLVSAHGADRAGTRETGTREAGTRARDWRVVGVHRPLGGYWYNYVLDLGGLVLSFVMLSVLLPLILPFSETLGFQTVVANLFKLTFTLFDVGVGSAVSRFIAEHAAASPKRAVRYVSFFIWFQTFTGLVQVTGLALYVLTFVPATNVAYLGWFMLAYSTIQYPGMLSIFHAALSGFQRFNKAYFVSFVQGSLLQVTTQVACVLLGRWWGVSNPAYGEMWGATLGWIVGAYVDDFLAFLLAAKMFRGVLGEVGVDLRLRDAFKANFSKDEALACLSYGFKVMGASVASNVYALVSTVMFVNVLPAYGTWIGLIEVADMVARFASKCELPINAPFAEAYLNGKHDLARYYLAYQWKLYGMMTFMWLVEILALAVPVIAVVGDQFGNYGLAAQVVPWLMLSRATVSTIHFSDGVMLGADKPEAVFYALLLQRTVGVAFRYLFLVELRLGWVGIPLADAIEFNSKVAFAWWFIQAKVLKVRVPWWQAFGASSLAAGGLWAVNAAALRWAFPALRDSVGLVPASAAFLAMALFAFPALVYFPLYGLAGGWDDGALDDFRAAAALSGPSKPFVLLLYHGTRLGARFSPLTNKFPVPVEGARRQAEELNRAAYQP
ncbi:MAG: hypothetical protein Kow0069_09320 [Promethearchaeota archaeon]